MARRLATRREMLGADDWIKHPANPKNPSDLGYGENGYWECPSCGDVQEAMGQDTCQKCDWATKRERDLREHGVSLREDEEYRQQKSDPRQNPYLPEGVSDADIDRHFGSVHQSLKNSAWEADEVDCPECHGHGDHEMEDGLLPCLFCNQTGKVTEGERDQRLKEQDEYYKNQERYLKEQAGVSEEFPSGEFPVPGYNVH